MADSCVIVDDAPDFILLAQHLLQKVGIEVLATASNAEDGLQAIDKYKPSFVIIDCLMPNMNGLEMIQHIRKLPGMQQLPIFVVSAQSSPQLLGNTDQYSNCHFFLKPLYISTLGNQIKEVLEFIHKDSLLLSQKLQK
jgi:CheY-like chemotaxis protein